MNITNCSSNLGVGAIVGAVIGAVALAALAAAALLAGLSVAGGQSSNAVAFDGSSGSLIQDSPLYEQFAGQGDVPNGIDDAYELL